MCCLAKAPRKAARSVPSLNVTNISEGRTTLHCQQSEGPAAGSAGTGGPCSEGPAHHPNQEYGLTSFFLPFPASYRMFQRISFPAALHSLRLANIVSGEVGDSFSICTKGKFLVNNKPKMLCACVLQLV